MRPILRSMRPAAPLRSPSRPCCFMKVCALAAVHVPSRSPLRRKMFGSAPPHRKWEAARRHKTRRRHADGRGSFPRTQPQAAVPAPPRLVAQLLLLLPPWPLKTIRCSLSWTTAHGRQWCVTKLHRTVLIGRRTGGSKLGTTLMTRPSVALRPNIRESPRRCWPPLYSGTRTRH